MKTNVILVLCGIIAIMMVSFLLMTPQTTSDKMNIRVGWQIPWATEGQLVQVMKHNELLEKEGFTPEYIGFTYGGPLNEAALAKKVDVIFTADQPAAILFSKSDDWVIVARLMYNRVSLYVPPNS